jgi:hypothetical protein
MSSYSYKDFVKQAEKKGFKVVSIRETKNHPVALVQYIGSKQEFSKREIEVTIAKTPSCSHGLQNILSEIRKQARELAKEETMPKEIRREDIPIYLQLNVGYILERLREGYVLVRNTPPNDILKGAVTKYFLSTSGGMGSKWELSKEKCAAAVFLIDNGYLERTQEWPGQLSAPTKEYFSRAEITPSTFIEPLPAGTLAEESAPAASKVAEEVGLALPESPKKREILGALQNLPENQLDRMLSLALSQLEDDKLKAKKKLEEAKEMFLEAQKDLTIAQEEFDLINPLAETLEKLTLT